MSTVEYKPISPEKRRHTRVDFTRGVRIFSNQEVVGRYPAKNLSLGGIFIQGDIDIPVGEECCLEMRQPGSHASFLITFSGKILRRDQHGVGVAFVEMERDSYMYLQTMVLYSAADPSGVAENFREDFAPDFRPTC